MCFGGVPEQSWMQIEETFCCAASLITCSVSLSFVSVIVSRPVSVRQRTSARKRKWPVLGFSGFMSIELNDVNSWPDNESAS